MNIRKLIEANPEMMKAIDVYVQCKPHDKSFIKACEELNELSAKLLKEVNHPGKVVEYDLLEEMLDVQINIMILERIVPTGKINVENIIDDKLEKILRSKKFHVYKKQYDE